MTRQTLLFSFFLALTAPIAVLADTCQLTNGGSVTIDEAGNVTAPANYVGWRLSDKDDESGLEIYLRGSSPRKAEDISNCAAGGEQPAGSGVQPEIKEDEGQ